MDQTDKIFLSVMSVLGLIFVLATATLIPVNETYIGEISGIEVAGEHCIVNIVTGMTVIGEDLIEETDSILVNDCQGLDGSRVGYKLYKTSSIFGNELGYKVQP